MTPLAFARLLEIDDFVHLANSYLKSRQLARDAKKAYSNHRDQVFASMGFVHAETGELLTRFQDCCESVDWSDLTIETFYARYQAVNISQGFIPDDGTYCPIANAEHTVWTVYKAISEWLETHCTHLELVAFTTGLEPLDWMERSLRALLSRRP